MGFNYQRIEGHITNWNSYTNTRIQLSKRNFIIFSLERANTALSCRIQAEKIQAIYPGLPHDNQTAVTSDSK